VKFSRHFDKAAYYFCLGNLSVFLWAIIWQITKAINPLIMFLIVLVTCILSGIILSKHPEARQAIAAGLTTIAWGVIIVQL